MWHESAENILWLCTANETDIKVPLEQSLWLNENLEKLLFDLLGKYILGHILVGLWLWPSFQWYATWICRKRNRTNFWFWDMETFSDKAIYILNKMMTWTKNRWIVPGHKYRLGLCRWLFMREKILTLRTQANRDGSCSWLGDWYKGNL